MTQNNKSSENRQSNKAFPNLVTQHNSQTKIQHAAETLLCILHRIDDPRSRSVDYPLSEILFISLIALLCGSESYDDIATFGNAQINWFKQFIPLTNGVPAHDTFRRVFMLLKPGALNAAYNELLHNLYVGKRGKHLAIDGKASRGCSNVKGQPLLNTVSAWDWENGICFGQVATKNDEGKESGEFNAIPKLIEQLDINDTLVTIDAGGCYAEITNAIIDGGGGSYAITLKGNQPTLHELARSTFEQQEQNDFAEVACYRESNRGHGREEERTYYAVAAPTNDERLEKWAGLSTLVMSHFRRSVKGAGEQEFVRYYISSLRFEDVERLSQSLRGHWSIENGLHWVLDVSFGEDANRTRRGNGAENLTIVRRLALGMLRKVKGKKTIPNVQFRAAVDPEFRTEVVKKFLMR